MVRRCREEGAYLRYLGTPAECNHIEIGEYSGVRQKDRRYETLFCVGVSLFFNAV